MAEGLKTFNLLTHILGPEIFFGIVVDDEEEGEGKFKV